MNIFNQFRKSKQLVEKSEFLNVYEFSIKDIIYRVIIPRKFANKHSVLHCKNNTIIWEQKPLIPGLAFRQLGDMNLIYKHTTEFDRITLFVVKGRPNSIIGLDDGVFCSKINFDNKFVNVISFREFKQL